MMLQQRLFKLIKRAVVFQVKIIFNQQDVEWLDQILIQVLEKDRICHQRRVSSKLLTSKVQDIVNEVKHFGFVEVREKDRLVVCEGHQELDGVKVFHDGFGVDSIVTFSEE